jgi:hypothetical protein
MQDVLSALIWYPVRHTSHVVAKIDGQVKQFCTTHIGLHYPFSFL